jgi:hypothetical protein
MHRDWDSSACEQNNYSDTGINLKFGLENGSSNHWRPKIDNGGLIFIYLCSAYLFLLKSIVVKVCGREYL